MSNDSFVFTGGKVHNRHTVSESQFSFDAHNDPPIAGNVDGIGNLKEFSIPETQQNVEMCELSNDSFVFTGGKVHNRHTVSESQFSFDAHNDPPIAGNVDGIGNLKEFSIPETQQNVEMCELSNDSFVFTGGKVHNRHTVSESQFSFDAHNDPPIAGNVDGIGNLKEFSIPETQQNVEM